ncbi:hypothetical protein IQ06DRAFT_109899 [Phaeosphaeriaceae sp. SRC1lsM3a]|nr:hypothetical protein IQ06DRAFT_109899 [Stagonospora sp. SRC1lsM3a]
MITNEYGRICISNNIGLSLDQGCHDAQLENTHHLFLHGATTFVVHQDTYNPWIDSAYPPTPSTPATTMAENTQARFAPTCPRRSHRKDASPSTPPSHLLRLAMPMPSNPAPATIVCTCSDRAGNRVMACRTVRKRREPSSTYLQPCERHVVNSRGSLSELHDMESKLLR